MLHRVTEGAGPRIVLVHGFTQTLRSWDALAARLALSHEVVRVDLPGHGGSGATSSGFAETAHALGDAGGAGAYVGYSMGGRLCLRLALDRPAIVRSLVLLGASPGLLKTGERAERRRQDEARARELERVGVDAFLEQWLAQPVFATLPRDAAGLEHRRANSAAGLAAALRRLGTGAQEPLWDRLSELSLPVLLVAGERDHKFCELARAMAQRIGEASRVALIPDAGHAAHLEVPGAFAGLVQGHLAGHHATE